MACSLSEPGESPATGLNEFRNLHVQEEIILAASKATEPKFSIAKAAEIIGVHPATVSRLMDSHKLGYYQVGTRRIVGKAHLEEYLSLAERKASVKSIH